MVAADDTENGPTRPEGHYQTNAPGWADSAGMEAQQASAAAHVRANFAALHDARVEPQPEPGASVPQPTSGTEQPAGADATLKARAPEPAAMTEKEAAAEITDSKAEKLARLAASQAASNEAAAQRSAEPGRDRGRG